MNDTKLMIIRSVIEGKLPEDFVDNNDLLEFTSYIMDVAADKANPCLPHYTYGIQ